MSVVRSNLIYTAALLFSALQEAQALALPLLDDGLDSPLLDIRAQGRNRSRARKLAKGAIIGIAIGCAVFVLIVVLLIWCCCCRKRGSKKAKHGAI